MKKFAVKMFDFLIFQRQIRGLYALGKQQLYISLGQFFRIWNYSVW